MKTLDEYMKLPYRMEIIPDTEEGGYVVSFPELPGCLTCADTLEQAVINGEDAKREWITAAMEEGIDIPEPVSLDDYSGQFKLRIPKSLHHALATLSILAQKLSLPISSAKPACSITDIGCSLTCERIITAPCLLHTA